MTIAEPDDPPRWPETARALAERLPMERLERRACSTIKAADASAPLLLACSGGADSVCATLLVWAHFAALRKRLKVLHIQHRARGQASEDDAAFVRRLAESLSLPYLEVRATSELVDQPEAVYRSLRLDAYAHYGDHDPPGLIVLGHHGDDVAETLLMRLARGVGAEGLAAPRPVSRFERRIHLRPLLTLSRHTICHHLRGVGARWREDASNLSAKYLRNRVRSDLFPVMEAIFGAEGRNWKDGFLQARKSLQEEAEALDQLARQICPSAFSKTSVNPLPLQEISTAPTAIRRRCLSHWLAGQGLRAEISSALLDLLVRESAADPSDAASGPKRWDLPGTPARHLEISLKNRALSIFPSLAPSSVVWRPIGWPLKALPLHLGLPSNGWIEARVIALDHRLKTAIYAGEYNEEVHAFLARESFGKASSLTFRQWATGDAYQPLGAPGTAKLQDLFVNRKIPREERMLRPLVCLGNQPLWCPGLPPAQKARITDRTAWAVALTYQRKGSF